MAGLALPWLLLAMGPDLCRAVRDTTAPVLTNASSRAGGPYVRIPVPTPLLSEGGSEVYLRSVATKKNLHVKPSESPVLATWGDHQGWQKATVARDPSAGDAVVLKFGGQFLELFEGRVRAREAFAEGAKRRLIIEKFCCGDPASIMYGDSVRLKFDGTGEYLGINPDTLKVEASAKANGEWSRFVIEDRDCAHLSCDWSPQLPEDGPLRNRENALLQLGHCASAVYWGDYETNQINGGGAFHGWTAQENMLAKPGRDVRVQRAVFTNPEYPGAVILAFRGSQNGKDLPALANIAVGATPKAAINEIAEWSRAVLAKSEYEGRQAYVTGQSLGGFYAEVLASTLSLDVQGAAFNSPGTIGYGAGWKRPPFEVHLEKWDPIASIYPSWPCVDSMHIRAPVWHDTHQCHGCTGPYVTMCADDNGISRGGPQCWGASVIRRVGKEYYDCKFLREPVPESAEPAEVPLGKVLITHGGNWYGQYLYAMQRTDGKGRRDMAQWQCGSLEHDAQAWWWIAKVGGKYTISHAGMFGGEYLYARQHTEWGGRRYVQTTPGDPNDDSQAWWSISPVGNGNFVIVNKGMFDGEYLYAKQHEDGCRRWVRTIAGNAKDDRQAWWKITRM